MTSMFARRARVALLGACLAAALMAVMVSLTGTAGAGGTGCPSKTLCVYGSDNFAGDVVKISKDGISNKIAEKLNNAASSVVNNRNRRSFLYDGKNGKGERVCITPHAEITSLGAFSFNDLASSSKNTNNKTECPV